MIFIYYIFIYSVILKQKLYMIIVDKSHYIDNLTYIFKDIRLHSFKFKINNT